MTCRKEIRRWQNRGERCRSGTVCLFDLDALFFVPTHSLRMSARAEAVKVGAMQILRHASAFARRHTLTAPSATALLLRSYDDQRGAISGAGSSRHDALIQSVQRSRTMMQICASAAKLPSTAVILPLGITATGGHTRDPATYEPSSAIYHKRNAWARKLCPSAALRLHCGVHWNHALTHETP